MPRIVIVGSSCAGKTTLAKQLAARLGIPRIELDALFWLPHWQPRDDEDFLPRVEAAAAKEHWVTDGNYSRVRNIVWKRADTIIWLDYSFPRVCTQALTRTVRRSLTKEELYSGNSESLRKAFLTRDSILLWVLTSFHRRRREYTQLQNSDEYPHVKWHRMRHPRETERLVRDFASHPMYT